MLRKLHALAICASFVLLPSGNATAVETDSPGRATNPVIWADVPDMAILRVGDVYYMSSTTMHMSPGVPIMKSHDLVDWKLVGYAYDTLADNDALNLQNGKSAYGAGSWASSLRFHDGKFYVSTFSSTTGSTHVYSTADIENGPWKSVSFKPMLHDNSLFFDDDGRVYMIHSAGNLRLTELTADVSGVKPGGVDEVIIENASAVAGGRVGLPAEGSQLVKANGKYYLFNITWPRGDIRTQIVHRADKITGPYEGRVILHDRGIAQGTIVDTPDGRWYAFLFQDHGSVGRIPYVIPMRWEDGWPVLGDNGKVPTELDIPADPDGLATIIESDEFDRQPGDRPLPLAWQWNHNPVNSLWSLTERPGMLRLQTGSVVSDFVTARNTLTQRTWGPTCSATTLLDTTQMKPGDYAGLGLLQKRYGFVGVRAGESSKSIVMVSAESESPEQLESIDLSQETVHFRIDCDFRDLTDKAYFYYSLDGDDWQPIGKPLQMAYTLPHFMGYRFGLFNYATESAGGSVDFDYCRFGNQINVD